MSSFRFLHESGVIVHLPDIGLQYMSLCCANPVWLSNTVETVAVRLHDDMLTSYDGVNKHNLLYSQ